jgi:hypothetical protein
LLFRSTLIFYFLQVVRKYAAEIIKRIVAELLGEEADQEARKHERLG